MTQAKDLLADISFGRELIRHDEPGESTMVRVGLLREIMDQAEKALSLTPSGDPWKDIGSAPRDEEPKLLWGPGMRGPVIGFWSAWNRFWTTGATDRMHDHVLLAGVTHWLPLPPPPATPTPTSEDENG